MLYLSNNERIGRALNRLKPVLASFIEDQVQENADNQVFLQALKKIRREKNEAPRQILDWDVYLLLYLLRDVSCVVFPDANDRQVVECLATLRNDWAHQKDFTDDEAGRACNTVRGFIRRISPPPGPIAKARFSKLMEEELNDSIWLRCLSGLWPDEWEGRAGRSLHVAFTSADTTPVSRYEGVSLYVLPMDRPYQEGTSSSLAEDMSSKFLQSMKYPNSAVFLALDKASQPKLKDLVCSFLAWRQVVRESEDLLPKEVEGSSAMMEDTRGQVEDALRAGYCWLLVPLKTEIGASLEWKILRLEPSQNPVERAEEVLQEAGLLLTSLAATRLAEELNRNPAWRESNHLRISDLYLEFSSNLHLPRLLNWDVLDRSISDCIMDPECELFGYAVTCDDSRGYGGLYFHGNGQQPNGGLLKNRVGYLVKADVARSVVG